MSNEVIAYIAGGLFVLSFFFKKGRSFWLKALEFHQTLEARNARSRMYTNLYREHIMEDKPFITQDQFNKLWPLHDIDRYQRYVLNGLGNGDLEKHFERVQPMFDPANYKAPLTVDDTITVRNEYKKYEEESDPELDSIRTELAGIHQRVIESIKSNTPYEDLKSQQETLYNRQCAIHAKRLGFFDGMDS